MFQLVEEAVGGMLWANLALLFSLSLLPFTTAWMDESNYALAPVSIYGLNLLLAAITYFALQTVIIAQQGPESPLRRAIGKDIKGKVSPVLYLAGVLSALAAAGIGTAGIVVALVCFVVPAIMWLVPDRRIDRMVRHREIPG